MIREANPPSANLEDAIALAVHCFRGMVDKKGEPYILHLLRVMMQGANDAERMVGMLHDIVEDTSTTIDELQERNFPLEVVEAIRALTHLETMTYSEYVIALKKNSLARRCKLADLHDNYRLERVAYRAGMVDEDARRIQKYIVSYQFLQDELDESAYRRMMASLE